MILSLICTMLIQISTIPSLTLDPTQQPSKTIHQAKRKKSAARTKRATNGQSNRKEVAALPTYIACGCGCCGGVKPKVKCLYRSKGEDIQKIIRADREMAQNPNCALVGCSMPIKYRYCD